MDAAKSALLVFSVIAVVLVFLLETWRKGELNMPWHLSILLALLLPVIYALSAFLSTPSLLSLFGYNFEVGTFGSTLFGSMLLILVATIFSGTSRILQALAAFLISISLVALFVAIKVFLGGDFLVWGNFVGNMGNPIGNWTDLAVSFGLLSSFAALAIGMIPMKFVVKTLVYGAFVLGVALLAILNFSTAFVLTLGASIFLLLYFLTMEKPFSDAAPVLPQASRYFFFQPTFLPVVLGIISIAFLYNPNLSVTQGTLGDWVSRSFKVENIDVRPSLSATLGISKAVLSQERFLGSGPNTFGRDWLVYKPVAINTTPFWAVAFPFGVGFIPTQIASTGILGTALWLTFFVLLIMLGVKVWGRMPESRAERFALVSVFLITCFLWVSSFLYVPSATVLMFAFIFTGLFVAASGVSGIISLRTFRLKESSQLRFVSTLLITVIACGALFLGWTGFNKTVSAFYFKKAVDLSNITGTPLVEIENELNKAVKFSPIDTYYIALSRINFLKAQTAASATTGALKDNQATFEESLGKSIEAAKSAVGINPASYQNWVSLGMIYSALVPKPLSIAGAYESASLAYSEALKRNPLNPEIPLFLARLELNRGNREAARSFIRSSIALKEDYADAHLMLAQLEIQDGNTTSAIVSAEKLALLVSNNPGIYFELGLLKYSVKDYAGAIAAFSKALVSAPDYANAQYYLGLTFAQLGQLDKAQEQFEALAITNPDNEQVRLILKELRVGKRTFLTNSIKN